MTDPNITLPVVLGAPIYDLMLAADEIPDEVLAAAMERYADDGTAARARVIEAEIRRRRAMSRTGTRVQGGGSMTLHIGRNCRMLGASNVTGGRTVMRVCCFIPSYQLPNSPRSVRTRRPLQPDKELGIIYGGAR